MRTRLPRRYLAVIVLATLAVLAGTFGPPTLDALANSTAKDRTQPDPHPTLFPDATVAPLQQQLTAQSTRAHALLQQWWSGHARRPHDAQFVTWLQQHLASSPRTTGIDDASGREMGGSRSGSRGPRGPVELPAPERCVSGSTDCDPPGGPPGRACVRATVRCEDETAAPSFEEASA
jgi:hypothetical protein